MHIETFPLGPLEVNCYLICHNNAAVAIDPGGEPAPILEFLAARNLTLTHILNTHLHFDHLYGNSALSKATGAPILAAQEDSYLLDSEIGKGGMWGFPEVSSFAFEVLHAGEHTFAERPCTVLATPGHSPGSLSFYFPPAENDEQGAVFVGDLIFYRSIGRTDLPGGDLSALKQSVVERIFTLPEKTLIYSGHGPATEVGDEILNNPFFSDFQR